MTQIDYASAGVGGEPWGPIGFRWSARSIALIAVVLVAGVWLRVRHSPYTAVTVLPVAPFFMAFHDNARLVTADTPAGVRVWDVRTSRLLENPIRGAGVYRIPYTFHHASVSQNMPSHRPAGIDRRALGAKLLVF
jgi:hypothetical protein